MRQIVIDNDRTRISAKRGGGQAVDPDFTVSRLPNADDPHKVLELSEAIDRLVQESLDGALADMRSGRVPECVGAWRLLRELGAGGMAQMFEARREGADSE